MSPKQRVLAALDHRETGWVPIDAAAHGRREDGLT